MTEAHPPHPLHPDTLAVREAVARSQYGENSEALYLTSGYVQPSAAAAAARFAGEEEGFTYGRYGNPTVASFEKRLAALEGATSGRSPILPTQPEPCWRWTTALPHRLCSAPCSGVRTSSCIQAPNIWTARAG